MEQDEQVRVVQEDLAEILSDYDPPVMEISLVYATEGYYTGYVSWRGDSRREAVEISY